MINLGPDGEQSSQLIEMIKKFPTTAFLAGRLKEVGWESDYGQCLSPSSEKILSRNVGMNFLRYWNISGLFRSNLPRVRSEGSTDPCSRSRSRTFRRSTQVRDRSA